MSTATKETINKITPGFVSQIFDAETGKCLGQDFIAGDQVEYEKEDGEVFTPDMQLYFPFEMIQPDYVFFSRR